MDLCSDTTEGRFSVPRNRSQTVKQLGFEKCLALLDNKKGYPGLVDVFFNDILMPDLPLKDLKKKAHQEIRLSLLEKIK